MKEILTHKRKRNVRKIAVVVIIFSMFLPGGIVLSTNPVNAQTGDLSIQWEKDVTGGVVSVDVTNNHVYVASNDGSTTHIYKYDFDGNLIFHDSVTPYGTPPDDMAAYGDRVYLSYGIDAGGGPSDGENAVVRSYDAINSLSHDWTYNSETTNAFQDNSGQAVDANANYVYTIAGADAQDTVIPIQLDASTGTENWNHLFSPDTNSRNGRDIAEMGDAAGFGLAETSDAEGIYADSSGVREYEKLTSGDAFQNVAANDFNQFAAVSHQSSGDNFFTFQNTTQDTTGVISGGESPVNPYMRAIDYKANDIIIGVSIDTSGSTDNWQIRNYTHGRIHQESTLITTGTEDSDVEDIKVGPNDNFYIVGDIGSTDGIRKISPDVATVSGYVTDGNDNALEGVVISLNGTQEATTDSSGFYSATVDPDNYTITASKDTYTTVSKEIDLTSSQSNFNFTLYKQALEVNHLTPWMKHGSTQTFEVIWNNETSTDVTHIANVTSSNTSVVTVNGNTLTATSDKSINRRINVTFEYQNNTVKKNITVANRTMSNIAIMPPSQLLASALGFDDGSFYIMGSEIQMVLLAVFIGAAAAWKARNEYLGIGVIILAIILFWTADHVSLGIVMVAVFYGLFAAYQQRETPGRSDTNVNPNGGIDPERFRR